MDGTGPNTLTPPVCLTLKDLRHTYSVTLPERATALFNVLSVSRTPGQMIEICRKVAQRALDETISAIEEAGRRFQSLSGRADTPVPRWKPAVFTIRELMESLSGSGGVEAVEERLARLLKLSLPTWTREKRDWPSRSIWFLWLI